MASFLFVMIEPEILDILFPKVRAEILRLLFTAPAKQRYVRELARMSGLALRTVQEELSHFTAARLVTRWSNGYHLFYRANRDHPMFLDLLRIVQTSARLPRVKELPSRRRRRVRKHRAPRLREGSNRAVNWNLFRDS
jgi:predicted transcriptional regulator